MVRTKAARGASARGGAGRRPAPSPTREKTSGQHGEAEDRDRLAAHVEADRRRRGRRRRRSVVASGGERRRPDRWGPASRCGRRCGGCEQRGGHGPSGGCGTGPLPVSHQGYERAATRIDTSRQGLRDGWSILAVPASWTGPTAPAGGADEGSGHEVPGAGVRQRADLGPGWRTSGPWSPRSTPSTRRCRRPARWSTCNGLLTADRGRSAAAGDGGDGRAVPRGQGAHRQLLRARRRRARSARWRSSPPTRRCAASPAAASSSGPSCARRGSPGAGCGRAGALWTGRSPCHSQRQGGSMTRQEATWTQPCTSGPTRGRSGSSPRPTCRVVAAATRSSTACWS